MLKELEIINFKAFSMERFNLAPLTLFAGLNSMGKSTVLQALLLLRQSWQQQQLEGLALRGDLVTVGVGQAALNQDAEESAITFSLSTTDGPEAMWRFAVDPLQDWLPLDKSGTYIDSMVYSESLFGKGFHYLAAERVGPRVTHPVSDYRVRKLRDIGVQGEYAIHFLEEFGYTIEVQAPMRHPITSRYAAGDRSNTRFMLWPQVNAWLQEISPGAQMKTTRSHETDMMMSTWGPFGLRPTNVGFGLSYILPVLVALLSCQPGNLVLIENPEAHLHPRGQRMVGDLIARCASAGAQVLIETHSDHLLNGIRLAVRAKTIQPDAVQIYYVEQQPGESGSPQTIVHTPELKGDGSLSDWPDGFFDEWEVALRHLLSTEEGEGGHGA